MPTLTQTSATANDGGGGGGAPAPYCARRAPFRRHALAAAATTAAAAAAALRARAGGFDIIGSGRDKIETPEQFAASRAHVEALRLDGLVVIGGDDSSNNVYWSDNCGTDWFCFDGDQPWTAPRGSKAAPIATASWRKRSAFSSVISKRRRASSP